MFEINDDTVNNSKDIDVIHGGFYCLMDVLFSKISTKKFLAIQFQV